MCTTVLCRSFIKFCVTFFRQILYIPDEKSQPMEVNGSQSTGTDGAETGAQDVKVGERIPETRRRHDKRKCQLLNPSKHAL